MFQGYGSAGSATIMYLFQSDVTGVTSGTWTWDTNYQAANQYVPTAINENVNYYEMGYNTNSVGTSKILVLPICFTDSNFTASELQDIQKKAGNPVRQSGEQRALLRVHSPASSKKKSPLFPPCFSTRWISFITMRLSMALHIS